MRKLRFLYTKKYEYENKNNKNEINKNKSVLFCHSIKNKDKK